MEESWDKRMVGKVKEEGDMTALDVLGSLTKWLGKPSSKLRQLMVWRMQSAKAAATRRARAPTPLSGRASPFSSMVAPLQFRWMWAVATGEVHRCYLLGSSPCCIYLPRVLHFNDFLSI